MIGVIVVLKKQIFSKFLSGSELETNCTALIITFAHCFQVVLYYAETNTTGPNATGQFTGQAGGRDGGDDQLHLPTIQLPRQVPAEENVFLGTLLRFMLRKIRKTLLSSCSGLQTFPGRSCLVLSAPTFTLAAVHTNVSSC